MLDSISDRNTQKFVVYLSDGDPNRYVNDVGTGNATERAVYSAKQLRQNHPEVTIMTLGVSSDPGTDVLAPTGEDRYWDMYAQASDKDKFTNAFKAITDIIEQKYERPVVRDEMGSNVRFVENSMRTWKTTENADSSEGTASYDEQSRTITWDAVSLHI